MGVGGGVIIHFFIYTPARNFCLGEPVITDEWNTLLHVVGLSTALAQFSSGWDDSGT